MYIDVDGLFSGEYPFYSNHDFDVYLDGVKQELVVALDTLGTYKEPRGWVEKYVKLDDGSFKICGDDLETEIVYGKVEIKV